MLGPVILLLSHADQFVHAMPDHPGWAVILLIVLFVGWLFGSILALVAMQQHYRKRWAPLREVAEATFPATR